MNTARRWADVTPHCQGVASGQSSRRQRAERHERDKKKRRDIEGDVRHTVFFSNNYAAEFDDIFLRSRTPENPTVYVCAQDREDTELSTAGGPECVFCLINAPAIGDAHAFDSAEITHCETSAFGMLERCGLRVYRQRQHTVVTTPTDFERLFPATGGALYGQDLARRRASFTRPGCHSRIPGLYLAGKSAHPGPGVPMAALSGRLAAASLFENPRPSLVQGRARMSSVMQPSGLVGEGIAGRDAPALERASERTRASS